jgi:hypothetical protein
MRIFYLQGLGAPDKPKKIKYAEIDFTSHYSFLRVRQGKINFDKIVKKTHPIGSNFRLPHSKYMQHSKLFRP